MVERIRLASGADSKTRMNRSHAFSQVPRRRPDTTVDGHEKLTSDGHECDHWRS